MKTQVKCPVCGEYHDHLVANFHKELDAPLVQLLKKEASAWQQEHGACTRCLDHAHIEFQSRFFEGTGEPGEVNGYKILPTPVRLFANEQYRGKGVTICMIDSGFYPHPDLIYPKNRVLLHLDITQGEEGRYLKLPTGNWQAPSGNHQWHGTMTSVVCAGNGHLSGGIYKSLAPDVNLVLLKVMEEGSGISAENIVKAIDWAIASRKHYNIRIINLSVTDDEEQSWTESEVDKAVERAVSKGIVVVAAAGNDPAAPLKAPANSPHAITVGGLDDRNTLDPMLNTLYHSTYGETIDRFHKPDIIAPAIWLAAPILPGTKTYREAGALFSLAGSGDSALKAKLANLISTTGLDRSLLQASNEEIKEAVSERIAESKFISPYYQHADGTSFAAPIVCSVIAQMLEANPQLDPFTVREILLVSARKLAGESAGRQGWGVVSPAHAVQMAAGKPLSGLAFITPVIDYSRQLVEFYLTHEQATDVTLTGDFNNWSDSGFPLHKNGKAGQWITALPFSQSGVYRYKYLIDKSEWLTDPRNLYKEEDGFDGFNSLLIIP